MTRTATRSTLTTMPGLRRMTRDDGEPACRNRPPAGAVARRREAVLAAWREITGGDRRAVARVAAIAAAVRSAHPEWAGVGDASFRQDVRALIASGSIPTSFASKFVRGRGITMPNIRQSGPTPPRKPARGRRGPQKWTAEDEATREAVLLRLGEVGIWLSGGDPARKFAPVAVDRARLAEWVREDKARRGRRARARARATIGGGG